MQIDTDKTHCTVDTGALVDTFVSDTEYAARVRSSPNMDHYKGQWSAWSSEVLWRTALAVSDGKLIFKDTDELGKTKKKVIFSLVSVASSLDLPI